MTLQKKRPTRRAGTTINKLYNSSKYHLFNKNLYRGMFNSAIFLARLDFLKYIDQAMKKPTMPKKAGR